MQKVEMYVHRTGFRVPNEPMATHARRRLRLTRSQNPDPSLPQPDPSLWIMHYCQTEQQNQFPSRNIRVPDQIRHTMNERMQLQRHGQLVRKEFMLRDSASWPTINLPGNPGSAYPQQAMGYPNDVMAHMNRSQQQAYIQQQQVTAAQRAGGPSPAKRPRHGGPSHGHGSTTAIPPPIVANDPAHEDEDGFVGGDYMDYLTPRDISLHRYMQHHDWLEQILESPYDTDRIIPGDLGLGRKGELESLTRDFFDAPMNGTANEKFPIQDPPPEENYVSPVPPRIGRLEAGRAEDFTKRATEKVAQINSEMEKLKKQHARRMAKLQKGRDLKEAEEKLRIETLDILNGDPNKISNREDSVISDITHRLFGREAQPIQEVDCVQKGGLEEKTEEKAINEQDYDMVDNLYLDNALDDTRPYQSAASPAQGSPLNNMSPAPQTSHTQAENTQTLGVPANQSSEVHESTAQPKETAAEDWIMVNKDENSPTRDQDQDLGDLNSFVNDAVMQSPDARENASHTSPQAYDQGGENPSGGPFDDQGADGEQQVEDFEANDFGEGIDFGDLDTAGDELSGYTQEIEDSGLGEHDDLGGNGDTFGDVFPPTGTSAGDEASGT